MAAGESGGSDMADVSSHMGNAGDVARELPDYRVERELGRGSMGVVYLADDVRLERKIALRVLSPLLAHDERFRARFICESQVVAKLDHAHIIPIYGAGEAGGLVYTAMRYVDGRSLRRLLEVDGPLPLERALAVVTQMADALDAAHGQDLVHGDVKPANILIDCRNGQEHCSLGGFGITRDTSEDSRTAADQLFGTFAYTSPEQIQGKPVDGRADVYALGCVLYECLTGVVPFPRDDHVALLRAHMHELPPPVTALCPDLPPAVDHIVSKTIEKQPEDRYSTCGELALALGAVATAAPSALQERETEREAERETVVQPDTTATDGLMPRPSSPETRAFAPPGVPLQRRGALSATSPPPPRRWPLVLGGVWGLIVVGILVAISLYTGNSRLQNEVRGALLSTDEKAFPNNVERALIGQVPTSFSGGCRRDDVAKEGSAGAVASVRCKSSQAAHEVVLIQFASQSARQDAYNRQLSGAGISLDTGGDCKDGHTAERGYEGGEGRVGRVLCHRANGSSFVVWTNDKKPLTLMMATAPDAEYVRLSQWWDDLLKRPSSPTPQGSPTPQVSPIPQLVPAPQAPAPSQAPPIPQVQPLPQVPPQVPPQAAVPQPKPREEPKPKAPPAPAAPDRGEELPAHVPAAFRSTCNRTNGAANPPGATAGVVCRPASGADRVEYFQFPDKKSMQWFFLRQTGRVWNNPGTHAESYDHGGGNAGRVLRFTNGEGKPQIEWTNERLRIYSVAVGSDADALVRSWEAKDFGPR